MRTWACTPGNTLLVPSGPNGLHLFIIALGPSVLPAYGSGLQVLTASATTKRDGIPYDPACVLGVGDHPFIQHTSYIAYRHMRLDSVAHVERMVSSSCWTPHEPCGGELLERVVAGIYTSKLTPREFKQLF